MTRRSHACSLVLTLAIAGGAAVLAAPSEKLVLVTVVSDETRAMTGLQPSDFTITEEKDFVQVVEAVPSTPDPLSIVLVVDTAIPTGLAATTPELRKGLTAFVSTIQAKEPRARIALYQVSNAARPVTDFTADRPVLDNAISVIASGAAAGSAMLEGVVTAAKRLGEMPAPRRAIVCVGMGTTEGTSDQPKDVSEAVRKSGATLWVVSVQSSTDPPMTNRDVVWTRVTAETGGLRQNAVQAHRLDGRLTSVANSLLSQYTLKLVRKKDGPVKGFKGTAPGGAQVLFTRWMR